MAPGSYGYEGSLEQSACEGVSRPLVVVVRADRLLQLRHACRQWRGADGVLRAVGRTRRVRRAVRAAAWSADVAGAGLDVAAHVRGPWWAAGAADPSLVHAADGGGDHAAAA